MMIHVSVIYRKQTSLPSKIFFFVLLLSGLTCSGLFAQRGNNQIAIGAEVGPVLTDRYHGYQFGVGLPIKAYLGTGNHGQLMFRSGIHYLWVPSRDLFEPTQSVEAYLVPFALGYRRNFNNWYAEGSAGMAWEKSITDTGNSNVGTVTFSEYPLNYGIEVGYQLQKFDLGLSVQNNTINHHHGLMHTVLVGFKTMYKIGF